MSKRKRQQKKIEKVNLADSKFDVIEQMGIDKKSNNVKSALISFFSMELAMYLDLESRYFYTTRGNEDFGHLRKIKADPLNWKITNEQKKVGNLVYKKATAVIKYSQGNCYFDAWFCPAISNQFGPANYFGLPGLITEVYVKDKNYSYAIVLKKISVNKKQTIRIPLDKYKVLSNKESEEFFGNLK